MTFSEKCCTAGLVTRGAAHTGRCIARWTKWVIRRDGHSDDSAQPWTVYRWSTVYKRYVVWGVASSHGSALTLVPSGGGAPC